MLLYFFSKASTRWPDQNSDVKYLDFNFLQKGKAYKNKHLLFADMFNPFSAKACLNIRFLATPWNLKKKKQIIFGHSFLQKAKGGRGRRQEDFFMRP